MKLICPVQFSRKVYFKLQEAEHEASLTKKRYSSEEVLAAIRKTIESK